MDTDNIVQTARTAQSELAASELNINEDCIIDTVIVKSKNARTLCVVLIVLFIGCLLSFTVNFGISSLMGQDNLTDTYFDGKEHDDMVLDRLADTFYRSEELNRIITAGNYYLFGKLQNSNVMLGADEFLFPVIDKENNYNYVADYIGNLEPTREELEQLHHGLTSLTEAYAERGINCYIVVIPNSQSVYGDMMPAYFAEISDKTRLSVITSYLYEQGVRNFLNLTDALIDAKIHGELYNNTENSLNMRGAYFAYLAITEKLLPVTVTENILPIDLSTSDLSLHLTDGKELARETGLAKHIKNRTLSLSTGFTQKYLIIDRLDIVDMAYSKPEYKDDLPSRPIILLQFSNEWDRIIMVDLFSNTFGTTAYRTDIDFNEKALSASHATEALIFLHEYELQKLTDGSMLPSDAQADN